MKWILLIQKRQRNKRIYYLDYNSYSVLSCLGNCNWSSGAGGTCMEETEKKEKAKFRLQSMNLEKVIWKRQTNW